MTTEMFVVFTVMAVFLAGLIGVIEQKINTFYVFCTLFINFVWGVALGLLVSNNEFVWFGMPLLTTIVTYKIAKQFFPKFWEIISDKNNFF